MEFEQWKKEMESEATLENKSLKKKIEKLEKEMSELKKENAALKDDCRALCNRCYVTTALPTAKIMCMNCVLKEYPCEHMPDYDEQMKIIKEARKDSVKRDFVAGKEPRRKHEKV